DTPRQGVEAPGIHAVCQHFLAVKGLSVARVFPCLPSANQQGVIRFFQAKLFLMLLRLGLDPQKLPELLTQAAHASTAWHCTVSASHLPTTGHISPSSGQITLAFSVRP